MNKKINSFALSTIIFSISLAVLFGIINSYMLNTSKTSVPISLFIGYIISILLSLIPLKLFSINPNKDINDKLNLAYGKLNIILITYRLTSFLSSQYLVQTNKIYIFALTIFITYYIANKGIETASRVSTISFFVCIAIFIFDALGLLTHVNIENFYPLINTNKLNIMKSAFIFSIFFSTPFTYINIIKKNDLTDKNKFTKHYHIMHIISFLLITTAIIITLGVYGIHLANLFDYPLYTVLKKISLFSFIDSIENASIMLWPLSLINASSIILLFIFNIIESITKNSNKIKIGIMLTSLLIPYFFLMNNNLIESFQYLIIPTSIVILLQLTNLLTIIILQIKKA